MWRELARWCGAAQEIGSIEDWTPLRADRASEVTENYLGGEIVSRARVVGNRRIEAIIADRERRAQEMRARAIAVHGKVA
jgi:hypothetical protein